MARRFPLLVPPASASSPQATRDLYRRWRHDETGAGVAPKAPQSLRSLTPQPLRRAPRSTSLRAAEAFPASAANALKWSDIDLIGMHGQTVLHERPQEGRLGRTVQLGDAGLLARKTGVRVAHDFRTADSVAAGGEGEPLAPIYRLACAKASGLKAPLAILNIGGVANVTFWSGGDDIAAFDTGPGNGMIDLMVQARGAGRFDDQGHYASVGRVNDGVLAGLLGHPYFREPPPKSLDRFDFSLAALEPLELEDAAATLVAF